MSLEYKEQLPVILPNYAQAMMPNMWKRSKPIMVIQTSGGPLVGQKQSYSWTRDMPIEVANSVVKKFSNDYHIIQITRADGYYIDGVERIDKQISNMELFSLIVVSQKRVLIDSSLQHAAAAFNKPSTVFWVGTSPDVFGYKMHNNIKANLPKKANQLIGSYMFDFQFSDNLHECPYMELKDLFDLNLILNKI